MRASRRLTIARALIVVSLVFGTLLAAAALLVLMVDAAGRLPIPGLWTAGALLSCW